MPESSGDVEVLSPPRIHLASRRRFDLKLDLASALSGRQEKKRPRLDLLTAPALLSSRLSPDNSSSCSSGGSGGGGGMLCAAGSPGCVPGSQAAVHAGKDSSPTCGLDHHHHYHHHHHHHHHQPDRPVSASCLVAQTSCVSQHSSSLGQHSACFVGQHLCLGQQPHSPCAVDHHHHHHTSCAFRSSPRGTPQERTGGGVGGSSPMSTSSPSSPQCQGSGSGGSGGGGGVLPPSFRAISCGELAAKLLRKCRSVLVIDCRPFLCYNAHHVQGALNISCTDRFNRKRLQQGKVGVLDLLASTHGKDTFRRRPVREVVLYDERGGGGGGAGSGSHVPLESDSALHIVLTTLLREGRQPAVLQGGMKQFEAEHPDLVWSSKKLEMPGRLLCSPTNDTVEPEIETATASRVLPFLYLGNERDAAELERLRRHNITYVLNVTAHVPHYWHAHGIRYKRIPASDSAQQNLKQYFEEALDYIDEARQKGASVLIHCHAGVSRSATITIAYILKHSKMQMSDAYKYVKAKRGIISPNFNFLGQLLEYEQDLNKDVSLRVLSPRLLELESVAV